MTSADVLPLDRHRAGAPRSGRGLLLAGGVIGIALGGFFDGILLHQILQWHHFLSLVPGEALRDIKNQIIADGAFHVLMYVIAAIGLVMLWRARAGLGGPGAGRRLLGSVLLGFGIWQVIDVVVFHWIAGIHRIRVDVPNPLVWDIGWMVVFGVPTLILWGERDALLRREEQERRLAAMPAATLRVYPDTGHAVAGERPGWVTRDLEAFMRETPPA